MDTPYYLNHETDERVWTPPTGTDIDILRAFLSQITGLPLGWVVCHSKSVDRVTYKNLGTNSTHQAPPEGTNHAVLESYLANRFHSTYYNTTSWQHHTAGRTSTLLTRVDQKLETDIYEAQDLYNSLCRFFEGQRALQPPLDKAGRIGCRFRDHTTGRTCDATFLNFNAVLYTSAVAIPRNFWVSVAMLAPILARSQNSMITTYSEPTCLLSTTRNHCRQY